MANKWADVRRTKITSPEAEARVRTKKQDLVLEMNLSQLRQALGLTQLQAAEVANMTQGELSRVESRDDHLVSTLRHYVESLGGALEITAVVGNKRVKLTGV